MKILFVPALRSDKLAPLEYLDKDAKWITHSIEKKGDMDITEVFYSGGKNPLVARLQGGQIYIRGHGNPGDECIQIARGGERVHAHEVAERLIKTGLAKNFAGKIKCYNCHSADSGDTGKPAFATLLTNYMYKKGYRLARYYGYFGSLDSFYKDEGAADHHKYSRGWEQGTTGMRMVARGRASERRYEIIPVVN